MNSFVLDTSDPTTPRVIVDGEKLGVDVQRVTVDWQRGDLPKVYIEVNTTSEIEGEGVIHEQVMVPTLNREVLLEWLTDLDPVMLDQEALAAMGMGDVSTGATYLEVLKRFARGQV